MILAENINAMSVIIPTAKIRITKIDGIPSDNYSLPKTNITFVPPGRHTLTAVFHTGTSVGVSVPVSAGPVSGGIGYSSEVVLPPEDVQYSFEQGKNYTVDTKMTWSKSDYTFTEINEPATLEKVKEYKNSYAQHLDNQLKAAQTDLKGMEDYLAFARQNPNLLEGHWEVGPDRQELDIIGNKITYKAPKTLFIDTRMSYTGTFTYDQNTITVIWKKLTTFLGSFGQEPTDSDNNKISLPITYYYVLQGDTLDIKSGGVIGFTYSITGNFKKVK
ncbi:MAG: hypothetical protein LBP22_14375 [Deltaproteobacteria bacterium]|nr:hypothetical protein [Deltaproteobacteria bacterium]